MAIINFRVSDVTKEQFIEYVWKHKTTMAKLLRDYVKQLLENKD